MCTHGGGGPSGYLIKAPLYLKTLLTAHIPCAFKQMIWKSLFRLQVVEVPDEFPLSFLSLFGQHTQTLSCWGPSSQDHNLSSKAGKSLLKYFSKDKSLSFTIKERVRSGIPVSLTQASITPWISAVIVEPVARRWTQPDQKTPKVEKPWVKRKEIYFLNEMPWFILLPAQHLYHSQWLLQKIPSVKNHGHQQCPF